MKRALSVAAVVLGACLASAALPDTQREGSLYLKLFKDYQRVPGKSIVYRDPLRFPLSDGSVYVVWISTENGFGTATFQFSRGKLHVLKQD